MQKLLFFPILRQNSACSRSSHISIIFHPSQVHLHLTLFGHFPLLPSPFSHLTQPHHSSLSSFSPTASFSTRGAQFLLALSFPISSSLFYFPPLRPKVHHPVCQSYPEFHFSPHQKTAIFRLFLVFVLSDSTLTRFSPEINASFRMHLYTFLHPQR